MVIYPAIDLIEGRCVRLRQGDFNRKTEYSDDPVAVASRFAEDGARWLHVVDLEGAKQGAPVRHHLETVHRIVVETGLCVQLGGGIQSTDAVDAALQAGASRFVIGSALLRSPRFAEWCFDTYPDRAVAGIDCRDGRVAVSGWMETSSLSAEEAARMVIGMGCRRAVVTDVATDGMLAGPNLDLLRRVKEASGLAIIASGGVSSLAHLLSLMNLGPWLEGVIVGRALHEGRLALRETIAAAMGPESG